MFERMRNRPRVSRLGGLLLVVVAALSIGCGRSSEPPVPPPPLSVTTPALSDGTLGIAYNATVQATSGVLPHTWSVSGGALPDGLTLDGSAGTISGTPTVAALFTFTLQVTDAESESATQDYTVVIGAAGNPQVQRVSVASDGTPSNGSSGSAALSPDGRFIAFTSFGNNLVPNDINIVPDVFLRDLNPACNPNVTARVSVASDGTTEGNLASFAPALSALDPATNILFVAYASNATNLVVNDTNSTRDIFVTAVQVTDPPTCTLVPIHTARVSVGHLLPNTPADVFSSITIGNSQLVLTVDSLVDQAVEIVSGLGAGQIRNITTNDETTFTIDPAWTTVPDATSVFRVNTQGNNQSNLPTISADGAFVAYHSNATNLVEADTNFAVDVFVTEINFSSGIITAVQTRRHNTFNTALAVGIPDTTAEFFTATTIGSSTLTMTANAHVGRQAEIVTGLGQGEFRLITANDATTLTVTPAWATVPDATSVFRITTLSNQTADSASVSPTTIGNSALTMTTDEHFNRLVEIISGTGTGQIRAITANDATTLTVDPAWTTDPNATSVFRVDSQAAGASARARISPDAAFIGFNTGAAFPGEATTTPNGVFIHERATRLTTRVSIASDGTVGDLASSISALEGTNARFVLFQSLATNLVSNDTNDVADIFLHDRSTGATSRISLANDGSEADAGPDAVAGVSGGGQLVVFETAATNLVADDRNQVNDIFLRDLSNSTTRRLSLGLDGINPNAESFDVTISQDGSTIAFTSSASNLALNDTNSTTDVFLTTTGQLDPPMIVLSRLPATRAGAAYSAPLLTVGGTPPLTFSLSSGSLPPGIFLDSRSGRLVGMPQRAGRFQFTVAVMDADRPARLTRRTFTLLVKGTPEGNRPN